ncbi:sodium/proton-translocating pyrophosphatase [Bremerella sp. T1]|uniref:sodium/proton-translocating pyrophosphatase n=1 Tax=Bremerella sp. TYQ1 TaxID=3119568 RepID=UPI001CCA378B|nr:sodium/proton-translocating pyrophosphatase [Bremerella volcania]UBM38088.1 sodium/proton-translocating pyrophosphatase [Bremerella volcania]
MAPPLEPEMNPIARAYLWVGRIFTICGEMIVPGLLGYWLDQSLGFQFSIFALVGFLVGLIFGMTHLVVMATSLQNSGRVKDTQSTQDHDDS